MIDIMKKKYLVINSYFPTDPKNVTGNNIELETLLAEIKSILSSTKFDFVYLVGDLNCDFIRNTVHVNTVKDFMTTTNFCTLWSDHPVDFTHSYENENGISSIHTLDHILTLTSAKQNIAAAGVLHLVENMSDHEPVYAIIETTLDNVDQLGKGSKNEFKAKPKWNNASSDQKLEYNDVLFQRLLSLNIPEEAVNCRDVKCSNPDHKNEVDEYVKEILEAVSESGKDTIPSSPSSEGNDNSKRKKTAGWKDFVEPFQDKAHFWHSVWKSAGSPINTELHRIMKQSKNRFHYQIRKCRRVENYLKNNKIIENCLENDTDLFKEIKRQRSNANVDEVTIDGAEGDDIPDKFATIYKELFNRSKDDEKIEAMKVQIEDELGNDDLIEIERINSNTIKEAMDKIKSSKSDSIYDFSSDFLKNGPDILHDHLANILKAFAVHGHVTEDLLMATLVPLVKDKLGDLCSSKNYRSIAISSLILKLLDWVIIMNYGHLLKCSDFQFGFQQFSNTSLCSWLVYETIDQYLRNGSIVYGCLLDCTKAFDTVEHSKLFAKLLEAKVPKVIIRMLIFIYRMQTANVRWKNQLSEDFGIRNGVRQGAVISPVLFSFYMDSLFSILKKNKSGCFISNYYAGCIGYADDLLFLCPSRSGLQEMLDLAHKYVKEHQISFSTDPEPSKSKTKGIIFTRSNLRFEPAPLLLNGDELPWVDSSKYLGNCVTGVLDGFSRDCNQKRASYIGRNCDINQEFHYAHPEVKCRINRIYNSSFPGSVLWDFNSNEFSQIVNSWSVSVRHMWDLPYAAHKYLMEPLGGQHALSMIIIRYVKFIQSLKKSPKIAVQFLVEKVLRNCSTLTGKNVRYVLDKTRASCILDINISKVKRELKFNEIANEDAWRVDFIKEIANLKNNNLKLDDDDENCLTKEELDELLNYICTS